MMVRDLTEPYADARSTLIADFEHEFTLRRQRRPAVLLQDRRRGPAPSAGGHRAGQARPPKHWKEIIPQAEETLWAGTSLGNQFIASI